MINEEIRDREVRVIGADGAQLGVLPIARALELAEEAELDLVKIVPNAQPPVCKLMDYGKYKFEQRLRKFSLIMFELYSLQGLGVALHFSKKEKLRIEIV